MQTCPDHRVRQLSATFSNLRHRLHPDVRWDSEIGLWTDVELLDTAVHHGHSPWSEQSDDSSCRSPSSPRVQLLSTTDAPRSVSSSKDERVDVLLDLERLISRLLIDGYLKQEFLEQRSPTITAYLRPGSNAVQLTSSTSQRSSAGSHKIQIELTIRIEQVKNSGQSGDEPISKQRSVDQINELCLAELKEELKHLFAPHSYSTVLSEQTIKDLVKLMP